MARNVRLLRCPPDAVFRVFEDGWLFPSWVVGASRMRDVSDEWPHQGATLHHSFGVWPLLIDDTTTVLEYDPPHRFVLQARGWPIGEARVVIDVKARGRDSLVRIQEYAANGPAKLVPAPLIEAPLYLRNAETLHRLAYLAEGMSAVQGHASDTIDQERAGVDDGQPQGGGLEL